MHAPARLKDLISLLGSRRESMQYAQWRRNLSPGAQDTASRRSAMHSMPARQSPYVADANLLLCRQHLTRGEINASGRQHCSHGAGPGVPVAYPASTPKSRKLPSLGRSTYPTSAASCAYAVGAGRRRSNSRRAAAGRDDAGDADGAISGHVAGADRGGIPPAIAAHRRRPCYGCSEIHRCTNIISSSG